MKWLRRPGNLVLMSMVLAIGALAVWFWPARREHVRPVPDGDVEIAWLNPATGSAQWERFVAAVQRIQVDRPELGLQLAPNANPFPTRTTDVPEIAISVRGAKSRLWFRWYKLTGDLGHRQWIELLAARKTPPLAIMGGGTSDRAQELARELNAQQGRFSAPPPFLITSATSEKIPDPTLTEDEWPVLMDLYPSRCFRFCFTNRQMAEAVTEFIWTQPDLRPDALPIYLTKWEDDPYSRDLFHEFRAVLLPEGRFGTQLEMALTWRNQIISAARAVALLGELAAVQSVTCVPTGLLSAFHAEHEQRPLSTLVRWDIPYSVGGFSRPNRWEEAAALSVTEHLEQSPSQRRPLLIVPGAPQPARRFLRALTSLSPARDPDYIVATGDYIDFNTIYRDRNVLWPIQDLPITLVAFCHRNPVDSQAFRPDDPADTSRPEPGRPTSTGTHDLLLYRDIVETVVDCVYHPTGRGLNADDFRRALAESQLPSGVRRFDASGNLASGAGEYIVCLRPVRKHGRILPQAQLQVWNRRRDSSEPDRWQRVAIGGKPELDVFYTRGANAEKP